MQKKEKSEEARHREAFKVFIVAKYKKFNILISNKYHYKNRIISPHVLHKIISFIFSSEVNNVENLSGAETAPYLCFNEHVCTKQKNEEKKLK